MQGAVSPAASGRLPKDLVGDDQGHPKSSLLVETTLQSPTQYGKATGTCLQNRRAAETLGRAARGAQCFQTPVAPGRTPGPCPPSLPHELPSVPQEPGSGLPLPQESALHPLPPLRAPGTVAELGFPARSLPTELSADSPVPAGPNLASSGVPRPQEQCAPTPVHIWNTAAPRQAQPMRRGPGNLHFEQVPRTVPENPGHGAAREPSRHPETVLSGVTAPAWWGPRVSSLPRKGGHRGTSD